MQRSHHRARACAALLLAGVLLGACDGGVRVVGFGTTGGAGSTGGTGGTGGTGSPSALAGTWRSLSTLVLSGGGTMVLDLRWTFDATGGCSRTRIQTIIDSNGMTGTETDETIACSYTVSGSTMTVAFQGSSVPSRFSVAFSGGDLLLAGTRFQRIG